MIPVRSRHTQADVSTVIRVGVDRAGNPEARLVVRVLPGAHLGSHYRDGATFDEVLAEPAEVTIALDPYSLARLAVRALANKTRRAKVGPLRASAGRAVTRVEPGR